MTYGEKPECTPDASPIRSGFQASCMPGGLIFNMHHHHYCNDVMGWTSFIHQLAENCHSIVNKTAAPGWDPGYLDLSRFTKDSPDEAKVEFPSRPDRHSDHRPFSLLLFPTTRPINTASHDSDQRQYIPISLDTTMLV